MRIAVVGSREFPNLVQVIDFVMELPVDTVVVSGGARGVDAAAEWAAKVRKLPDPKIYYPDIQKGMNRFEVIRALFTRNTQIAEDADEVHAFFCVGQRSNGTFDTVMKAKRLGKYVVIHWADGTSKPLPGLPPPLKESLARFIYHWEKEEGARNATQTT